MIVTYRLVKILAKAMFLIICLVTPRPAAAQQPEIVTTVAFTEGPAVDRDGNVYFTDIINQRIMKLSRDGVLAVSHGSGSCAHRA